MERLRRRQFTAEFKLEAARYVLDQGMSFAEVGKRLGVLPKLVKDWVVLCPPGIVKLPALVLQWPNEYADHPTAIVQRLPLSRRDHQSLHLALFSICTQLQRRGRNDGRARRHCQLRNDPRVVSEVRSALCQVDACETWSSRRQMASQ